MQKILTIAIPAYNVEKYLSKFIPTFITEEIINMIEILIINDGSKDNTREVSSFFEKKYPDVVKVINKINGGHGSTINRAIKECSGKYFKIVDGDDYVNTENFVKLVKKLSEINADVVANPFNKVNLEQNKIEKICPQNIIYDKEYKIEDVPLENFDYFYQIHSITIKTEILKKIPAITENCFYVDQEYVMYPLPYIYTMLFLDYDVYQYQIGNQSQSVAMKNQQKNILMLEKVTLNLIKYENLVSTRKSIQDIMSLRNSNMIGNVGRIYLSIGKNGKIGCQNFIKQVKKLDLNNIQSLIKRKDVAILFESNNKLFSVISLLERIMRNFIKEK